MPTLKPLFSLAAAVLACLLLGAASAAPADTPRRTPSNAAQASDQTLQYEYDVVLKLIHVHVTDKKGNPVPDLTKDDFVVTDNGRVMTLTEFERQLLALPASEKAAPDAAAPIEAARAGSTAPTAPSPARVSGRKYFLFFDFAYNHVRGILKAREAALHFLDTAVRPDDEVAVLTYSGVGGLAIHEYLTSEHAKVRQVVEKIGHGDVKGRATQIEDQYWRLVQESPGAGPGAGIGLNYRAEAEALRQESKSMAQKYMLTLTGLARALRLVDGEKHFILFSTGIPNSLIYGYASDSPSFRGDFNVQANVAGDHVLRRQNEAMYQEFGASGCSFYAFDTRESAMETSLFTYDEQTLAMGSRSLTVAIEPYDIFKDDKATGLNSLKRLTDITGGEYYSNINMHEKNLAQVQALTGSYYVLGYAITERWDGEYHEVKVEVKREGCRVRTQAGYFNPKPFAEYGEMERQLHLFDLALNERAFSRLPVNLPMMTLTSAAEGISRLAVLARIPAEVTAKLAGGRLELVTLFFDEAGEISDIVRDEADAAALRGRDTAFAAGATLKPGAYSCRLVVRDMDSGLSAVGSARARIGKPQLGGLDLGTPLLLEARVGGTLISARGGKARESFPWDEIYPYDESLYTPILTELPEAVTSLRVILPCAVPGGVEPDLDLTATIVDAASGAQETVFTALSGRVRKGPLDILTVELPALDVNPGTYYLHIYAEDRATGSLGHTFTTLVVPRR
ncbi:MAG: VWA domain-containing protein [Candidatus Aminicenantes bacterium]|nr:VWA domain-containing protein [Candidatus Aminicenantes bacterium]